MRANSRNSRNGRVHSRAQESPGGILGLINICVPWLYAFVGYFTGFQASVAACMAFLAAMIAVAGYCTLAFVIFLRFYTASMTPVHVMPLHFDYSTPSATALVLLPRLQTMPQPPFSWGSGDSDDTDKQLAKVSYGDSYKQQQQSRRSSSSSSHEDSSSTSSRNKKSAVDPKVPQQSFVLPGQEV
eukprot:gene28952-32145_t